MDSTVPVLPGAASFRPYLDADRYGGMTIYIKLYQKRQSAIYFGGQIQHKECPILPHIGIDFSENVWYPMIGR